MAAENGEEKLIAVARHIVKSLGRTDTMTDDMFQIFSTFDGRFSRQNLTASNSSEPPSPDRTLNSLHRRISSFLSSSRPIWSDSASFSQLLTSVDDLLSLIRDLEPPLLDRAEDLLQNSMLKLEEEFRSLIEDPVRSDPSDPPFNSDYYEETDYYEDDQIPVANPVYNYDIIIDAIPPGAVADLHEISKRMVIAGFGREIANVYSVSRRSFLDESISRLGLRNKTIEELQSIPWPALEEEFPRWIKAITLSIRVLFPSERRLCDRIFAGFPPVADLSFSESIRSPAINLLNFAAAVATGGRSPEKLFRTLDMYEAIRDLIPDLEFLFPDQYSFLKSEIGSIYRGLGSAIRGIFMELENLIKRDPAKTPVPGGGLHPITRYVINYLRAACGSRKTLEEVMEEAGEGGSSDLDRSSSPLTVQIAWILEVLQGNLEAKAKIYKDPSLSVIFLMNNWRYIVQKTKDSELAVLMGDDWIRRQISRVKRWAADYQKAAWSKVIAVLRTDGERVATSENGIRERIKVFNAYFEEICREQVKWVLVDERLRAEVRTSTVRLVVPLYRNFLGTRGRENYIKYSVEDVEAMIIELFGGSGRRL